MELNNNPFDWGKIPKQKGVRLNLRTLKELILIVLEVLFIISAYLFWFIRRGFIKKSSDKTDPKNIKIVYYVRNASGVAEVVINIIKGFYLKGYKQVLVVAKDRGLKKLFKPVEDYLESVTEIQEITQFDIKNIREIISIVGVFKSLRADILHVQLGSFYAGRFITPIARFANIPKVIITELQTGGGIQPIFGNQSIELHFNQLKTGNLDIIVYNFLKSITNLLADKITVLFEDIAEDYSKVFKVKPTKISIVPNCLDLDRFDSRSNTLSFKKEKERHYERGPVIMVAATLEPRKGHYYLIKAAPKIISFFPNVKFVFFGDGLLKEDLKELSYAMRLDDHIEFMGQIQDREEWVESYRNANLFVHPSLIEGMPITIIEAMAMSLPVVSTSVDGNKVLVEHGRNGLLVPPRDSEVLADAIINLLGDFDKLIKFGEESRRRVEKYFSLDIVATQFDIIYRELLNKV